jgi:hypothetical protein
MHDCFNLPPRRVSLTITPRAVAAAAAVAVAGTVATAATAAFERIPPAPSRWFLNGLDGEVKEEKKRTMMHCFPPTAAAVAAAAVAVAAPVAGPGPA